MTNAGVARIALNALDRLTDAFPSVAPRLAEKVFLGLLANGLTYRWYQHAHRRRLQPGRAFESILVVADSGIGDAINLQHAVRILRRKFPRARIDYVCNRSGGELLAALPGVDRVFPVSTTNGRLAEDHRRRLLEITGGTSYELILNLCPFIPKKVWPVDAEVLDLYLPFASHLLRLWRLHRGGMSIPAALQEFLEHFLTVPSTRPRDELEANAVYLSDEAVRLAHAFLEERGLTPEGRLVFYNPDASSRYTLIPFRLQIDLVEAIAETKSVGAVLLGPGHVSTGIETRLRAALSPGARASVVLAPRLPLPAFAALVDLCDMFVSGDGGPLHVAAGWKVSVSGNFAPRNRTAVVAIFGATDSRMYGYDSERPDHAGTAQAAPSRTFRGRPPCRNVTCINKLGKTCRKIRCFEGIEAGEISAYVRDYFRSRNPGGPLRAAHPTGGGPPG